MLYDYIIASITQIRIHSSYVLSTLRLGIQDHKLPIAQAILISKLYKYWLQNESILCAEALRKLENLRILCFWREKNILFNVCGII